MFISKFQFCLLVRYAKFAKFNGLLTFMDLQQLHDQTTQVKKDSPQHKMP